MKIDYHVHLEEGPYSTNWLARTAQAIEFFTEDKAHSYEWMQTILKQLHKRADEGCYSEAWLDLYLKRAKQLGLKEVGIVDHLYRFRDARSYYEKHIYLEQDKLGKMQSKWLHQVANMPSITEFIEFIQSQKEKWSEEGVELRLGIEADYFPNGREELEELIAEQPWDYVIGSVHFLDGWGFDNPKASYLFEQENLVDLYEKYAAYVCDAIEWQLFDIIAHLDNLKVFTYRPNEQLLQQYYETVAQTLKKYDTASEVNTGLAYRYPIKEACPSPSYLKTLAKYKVPMTLSSDSHYPDDLGMQLDAAAKLLLENGYSAVVGFKGRERYEVGMEAHQDLIKL